MAAHRGSGPPLIRSPKRTNRPWFSSGQRKLKWREQVKALIQLRFGTSERISNDKRGFEQVQPVESAGLANLVKTELYGSPQVLMSWGRPLIVVRADSGDAICWAISSLPPFLRYAVMLVARKNHRKQ
jgi:hypothetical protein